METQQQNKRMLITDVVYENTCEVEFKGKKPRRSWMKDWPLEDRVEKFFEFCQVFDDRRDSLLSQEYQIFSHRLHWHEHPFCQYMQAITNNEQRLFLTLVFSFTNEHWQTFMHLYEGGIESARERFVNHRHARNDLFQIYYPKGTNVKEWILEGPRQAAKDLKYLFDEIEAPTDFRDKRRPYTMMEFAKKLEAYFKEHQNFRSPLYPCKNTARYIAMSYPHLVDPESILFGGTGHFDGLHQIFDGDNLNGKVKYEIDDRGQFVGVNKKASLWLEQMKYLVEHPSNPMKVQKYLNVEDKTCFFWKHIAISHGEKRPTKNIPYTWIFPNTFSLANDNRFLSSIEQRELMY